MAGHSAFSNIMHHKGAQDAKRAKIFTKIAREITVATKLGGPDPSTNPRLRAAITSGRAVDMPNDRIKRAIDLAVGAGNTDNYDNVRYEGYGPNGIAVIIECLTDNRTRTVAEVRSYFAKCGGAMGETNSVSFMFDHVGEIVYPKGMASADEMFEAGLEAGADNIESNDNGHYITCAVNALGTVTGELEKKFGEAQKSGFTWKHKVGTPVTDEDTARMMMKLIDMLEENDDVQEVFTNMDVSEDVMAKLSA